MPNQPLISVIVPVHNGGKYIEKKKPRIILWVVEGRGLRVLLYGGR